MCAEVGDGCRQVTRGSIGEIRASEKRIDAQWDDSDRVSIAQKPNEMRLTVWDSAGLCRDSTKRTDLF